MKEYNMFDEANIPVDIWLEKQEDGQWQLRAANYQPRRGYVATEAYSEEFDTKEEALEVIQNKMLPIYEAAVAKLKKILKGTETHLYYWE